MVHVLKILLLLFIIGVLADYFGTMSLVASLVGCAIAVVHWLLKQGHNGGTKK